MEELVRIQNLKKYFTTRGGTVHAIDNVSMSIFRGKTMGVVGESGCGKTTLGRVLVHMEKSTDGRIYFLNEDVTNLKGRALQKFRHKAQLVFQDPYSSLNPRYTVEETIQEPLIVASHHRRMHGLDRITSELMELVCIPNRLRLSYPHEMDGGMRQRVGIARALALNPDFIVCDEPVSALDVSIQAQILNLLQDLQRERNLTYMFITHDLSVVKHISDEISVMYLGQLVEMCSSKALFTRQLHPYTKALISAIPTTDILREKKRIILKGEITSPINPKPGCRFAPRCNYATDACMQPQELVEVEEGHFVACCREREINGG